MNTLWILLGLLFAGFDGSASRLLDRWSRERKRFFYFIFFRPDVWVILNLSAFWPKTFHSLKFFSSANRWTIKYLCVFFRQFQELGIFNASSPTTALTISQPFAHQRPFSIQFSFKFPFNACDFFLYHRSKPRFDRLKNFENVANTPNARIYTNTKSSDKTSQRKNMSNIAKNLFDNKQKCYWTFWTFYDEMKDLCVCAECLCYFFCTHIAVH